MGDLLLPRLACMGGKSMIERLAIDVLRVRWQVAADGGWKIGIRSIGHGVTPVSDRSFEFLG